MADPRESAEAPRRAEPQPYPAVDRTDAVQGEIRSFDPSADAPTPCGGETDPCPASMTDGRMGPGGDPAEGKRSA